MGGQGCGGDPPYPPYSSQRANPSCATLPGCLRGQRWPCLCGCGAWRGAAPLHAGPPTIASVIRVSWGISHICKKYWL